MCVASLIQTRAVISSPRSPPHPEPDISADQELLLRATCRNWLLIGTAFSVWAGAPGRSSVSRREPRGRSGGICCPRQWISSRRPRWSLSTGNGGVWQPGPSVWSSWGVSEVPAFAEKAGLLTERPECSAGTGDRQPFLVTGGGWGCGARDPSPQVSESRWSDVGRFLCVIHFNYLITWVLCSWAGSFSCCCDAMPFVCGCARSESPQGCLSCPSVRPWWAQRCARLQSAGCADRSSCCGRS